LQEERIYDEVVRQEVVDGFSLLEVPESLRNAACVIWVEEETAVHIVFWNTSHEGVSNTETRLTCRNSRQKLD
jgi:hypothetical protein